MSLLPKRKILFSESTYKNMILAFIPLLHSKFKNKHEKEYPLKQSNKC